MDDIVNLFNATMELGNRVNLSWQVFVTINTAVVGWLVTKSKRHALWPRIIATLVYLAFAFFMYKSLEISTSLYEAAASDLLALAKSGKGFIENSSFRDSLASVLEQNFWSRYWAWIYFLSVVLFASAIYLDRLSKHGTGKD
ncbi:MAG TPA: hypothetical protein ENJ01_02250 [Gammaproteobacteria bacterium]|nr:hypothetical protein [Gammaproteobacteria bacterium]